MGILPKIVAIVGPTASGKTALASFLASEIGGELLSVDSRQVYRGMDIATAKDLSVSQSGVDLISPEEPYSVALFKRYAETAIGDILGRGRVPMLVGGTGLWIDAIIDNFSLDADHPVKGEPKYDALQIGLSVDRDELYARIDARVDAMLEQGLEQEARRLFERYGCEIPSMTGIGYRQFCAYFQGYISREEAVRLIKRDSRHYAKRQWTWFKRNSRIHWVQTKEQALELARSFLTS